MTEFSSKKSCLIQQDMARKRAGETAPDSESPTSGNIRIQSINNSFLLTKLPGELRNRIYELMLNTPGYQRFWFLKHTPIDIDKQFESDKAWANAHKQRVYVGLTQTCQLIRREFRPMYLNNCTVWLDPHNLSDYVGAFGSDDIAQTMGNQLECLKHGLVPEAGLKVLPVLNYMAGFRISLDLDRGDMSWRCLPPWDISAIFATVHGSCQRDAHLFEKTGIESITIFTREIPERNPRVIDEVRPTVVFDLDSKSYQSMNRNERTDCIEEFLQGSQMNKLSGLVTEFRCEEWRSVWKCFPSFLGGRYVEELLFDEDT